MLNFFRRLASPKVILPMLALPAAIYLGRFIASSSDFGLRGFALTAMTVGLVLFSAYVLTSQRSGLLPFLFSLIPLSLLIGLRGLRIQGDFAFFLPQVYLYLLWVLFSVRSLVNRRSMRFLHSKAELAFLYIGVIGFIFGLVNHQPLEQVLLDTTSWLTFYPAIWLVHELEMSQKDLVRLLKIFVLVALPIGLSGLIEFLLGIGSTVAVLAPIGTSAIAPDTQFFRVSFLYWGGYLAAVVLLMALPLGMMFVNKHNSLRFRYIAVASILACVFGVAISGYRGLWIAAGLTFLLMALIYSRRAIWGLVASLGVVLLSPDLFANRFSQLFAGAQADSSTIDRLGRSQLALDLIKASPFTGGGWGSSGWVHNDILQIGADTGILAAILFVAAVLILFVRLWRSQRELAVKLPERAQVWSPVSYGLLFSLMAGFLAMPSQTFIVQPLLMALFWLIYAAAHRTHTLIAQELQAAQAGAEQSRRIANLTDVGQAGNLPRSSDRQHVN